MAGMAMEKMTKFCRLMEKKRRFRRIAAGGRQQQAGIDKGGLRLGRLPGGQGILPGPSFLGAERRRRKK
jgi:hypothetical protein